MNENVKQKWANRSAYIILALLLITVLVVTITAIASTVAKRNEPTPPIDAGQNGEGDQTPPEDNGQNGDTQPNTPAEPSEPEKPSEDENDKPSDAEQNEKVYLTPCDGDIQKDYSDDVLVFSATMNDYRVHLGIDISSEVGAPVRAFSDGKIEKIYTDPFMGKTIVIDHGNGLKSYYMNLSDTLPEGISEGTAVTPGTLIGAVGETAMRECADSPHLHFEIRLNDKRIDPTPYIKK